MKGIFVLFAALVVGIIALLTSLQNGSLLRYLDTHRHRERVPKIAYFIGQGYAALGNLGMAATYYYRVPEQYPDSPLAAPAYFNYLQTIDDSGASRSEMIKLYRTYLEKYPRGEHAEIVTKRIENYSNTR